MNKDNIHENRHKVYYDFKAEDDVILTLYTSYKYETPYKGHFVITQCFTYGTVKLQCSTTYIMYNMHHIKPCKYDTKVGDYSSKYIPGDVNI